MRCYDESISLCFCGVGYIVVASCTANTMDVQIRMVYLDELVVTGLGVFPVVLHIEDLVGCRIGMTFRRSRPFMLWFSPALLLSALSRITSNGGISIDTTCWWSYARSCASIR